MNSKVVKESQVEEKRILNLLGKLFIVYKKLKKLQIIIMSKLYKTTYPSRQPNYNNFLNSAQGSRDESGQNKLKSSTITKKQVGDLTPNLMGKIEEKNFSRHIQKKIQIDPTLLFTAKKASRTSTRPIDNGPRIIINKTQSRFYEHQQQKQRPKSKQQPRLKINIDPQLKSQVHFPQRPHTSKGPRPFKYVDDVKKRKMSFENDEGLMGGLNYKEMERRAMISSSQSRRPSKTSKYNFETSIDPQFLNLFAAN